MRKGRRYLAELTHISKQHRGILRAVDVVAFARNRETALHGLFTWNDGKAAEQWRLHQARNLIRVSVAILPRVDEEFRAFVSLRADRVKPQGGYRAADAVLSDKTMRADLLAEALRDLEFWKGRYSQLREFSEVFAAIRRVSARIKGKHRKRTAAA